MTDIWSKEKRSECMSKIRSKDTKPELTLRKALFARGFRYRVNDTRLPGKNGYTFNGSKIDKQFSYSKIDFQLKQNDRAQNIEQVQNQSSFLENAVTALGGLFDIPTSETDYDPDEAEFQRQHKFKKKKKRGFHL